MRLLFYIARRIAWLFFVIFIVVTITFILSHVVPSNPALIWAGPHATKQEIEKAIKELGLDKPLIVQYLIYWKNFLTGNWGVSIHTRRPVIEDIKTYLPATMELAFFAMFVGTTLGVLLGLISGVKYNSVIDHVCRIVSLEFIAVPMFWLGIMLQLVLAYKLHLLPLTGRYDPELAAATGFHTITGFVLLDSLLEGNIPMFIDALKHILLPGLTLATGPFAIVLRVTRASVLEVLGRDYVRHALSYGLPRKVIMFKYVLRNALSPILTVIGLEFGYVLSGNFVVEEVFEWPGLGRYVFESILNSDYPAILGSVTVIAIIYVIVNLIVDIVYALVNPKVRY
ncbi:MAG: ABC transporter permease [Crenarchaeota archaeon]|nr:ABC transporter permease [Thermoproteota archaeon]